MRTPLLCVGAMAMVAAIAVTPVQKVVQMLQDMHARGQQEKQDEEVRFSEFSQWCDDTRVDKNRAIAESKQQIEQLTADKQKAESDANQLGKEVGALQAKIASWEAAAKAGTEVRNKERSDYATTHTDYSESIDALQRAIVVLKRQSHDRNQSSLLQESLRAVVRAKKVAFAAKQQIKAFLAQADPDEDFLSRRAPEANAYEFQSGGVVEMLEKLLDKFVEEKRDLEKEEMNAQHSFEMIKQDLTDNVENATAEAADRSALKSKREQAAANAQGDIVVTTKVLDEDTKYLNDMNAECRQKGTDFESRQKLRTEELEAISQAIEILSSDTVSGHAEKYLPTLLQKRAAASFLQLRASGRNPVGQVSPVQDRVADFLAQRAGKSNSRMLAMLAAQVQNDPFDKVKKMIWNLIVRLQEEANQETEHKGWCDAELSANKVTREHKSEEVESLQASAEELEAEIAKLTQETADLSQQVSDIERSVQEATAQRNTDKEKNAQTVADAKEAQTAVARALTVLREFYAKAETATAFAQQTPQDDAPATFDAPYTGLQNVKGGVVGMLEVIQSDFARLEAETSAAEDQAVREFKEFTNDAGVDRATKNATIDHKTQQKQHRLSALQSTKKDLNSSQEELDAASAYYEKLKPSCVDAGVSYEERVARREEEIQSLKEALEILSGDQVA